MEIPKADGGMRPLGIPTVADRIAQEVAHRDWRSKSTTREIIERLNREINAGLVSSAISTRLAELAAIPFVVSQSNSTLTWPLQLRAAKIGDKLIVTTFTSSITRGFAAVGEPGVAVCLLPGTEVAFEENVKYEPSFGINILPDKKISQRLARFRQINLDNAVTHHDALEFPDGQVILLTRLREGQRAAVLQLPAPPRAAKEVMEQADITVSS